MKNFKLIKITLILITSLVMLFTISGKVKAADNTNQDLLQMINDNTTGGNSTGNNTTGNNLNITNIGGNNTTNNTTNNTINNTLLTTNNTSNYNNTSLPKTGIEDTIPATLLIVVFSISAIYAYKKIQDYKNI